MPRNDSPAERQTVHGTRRTLTTESKLTPLQLRRKTELLRHGVTAADIARTLGVSRQAVGMVINDRYRSERIETAIAKAVGLPRETLFPARDAA